MSFAKNYHRWILKEFLPYMGNCVAEVGAGVGNFSGLILETDVTRLVAFEPSTNMFPVLREALSMDERAIAINGFFGSEYHNYSFDSVFYINVLEHIEEDARELANVYDAISPEGYLLLFVPALPWLYSELDKQVGHFRRYTKNNLLRLIKQSGFSVVKVRYFDIAGIIPWYIYFTLRKNSISERNVSLYDRIVVPIMSTIEQMVSPPIGKNVLLVARKPHS